MPRASWRQGGLLPELPDARWGIPTWHHPVEHGEKNLNFRWAKLAVPHICKASVSEHNTALPWSIWVLWLWYVMVIHPIVGSLIMRYKGYRNSLYEGITIPQSNPTYGCRWYVPLYIPIDTPLNPNLYWSNRLHGWSRPRNRTAAMPDVCHGKF